MLTKLPQWLTTLPKASGRSQAAVNAQIPPELWPQIARRVESTEHVGIGMVVVGIVLLIWSLFRYHHVNHHILVARLKPSRVSVIALTVTIILTGAATTVYLMMT